MADSRQPDRFRGIARNTREGRLVKRLPEPSGGTRIEEHRDRAARLALTEVCDVETTFNEHPAFVSFEQAEEILSPEELAKRIKGLIARKNRLLETIESMEGEMLEEFAFGKKIYGDKFPNSF